ncbi:MAG TPA: Gldg family protein [Chloroflexota bacterium]|jgi:ABC-type uncharacterized transport system involved in gliding motility auxiliary subunit
MLDRLKRQLPAIFAGLGVLGLAVAAGLFLVQGEIDRWVITSAAVGLIFVVYALLERPESLRETVTTRDVRYGANTLVMTVAFVGILALLNVLGNRFSYRWDLTESKDFSLSPQTEQVLRSLNGPVKFTAFYKQGQPGQEELQDLLKSYQRINDRVAYEFVDPELMPGVARDYKVEAYGTTVVESEGRRQNVTGSAEGDLTSALLKVQRGDAKKVGWVVGHGELDPESFDRAGASEAKRLIEQEGYKVENLTLLAATELPADVAVVVLAGPRQPLLPQENEVLQKYLDNGGKLLVMLEPRSPGNPGDLLGKWGLEVGQGIVLDFDSPLQGDPLTPLVTRYSPNAIMRNVDAGSTRYVTVFPGATMVRAKEGRDQQLQVQTIAESSPGRSWLESDQQIDVRTVRMDEGKDVKGPVPMVVSSMKNIGQAAAGERQKSTRIVAVGNASFATNNLLSFLLVAGNRDLLLNSVNWLAEDEQLISVRSKVSQDRTLLLQGPQQNLLLYSSTLFLPLAVLSVGAYVWWQRR